jgi:cobaltochelatase CobT
MRAIAGDHELEVSFAKDRPALAGNLARLPELPKKLEERYRDHARPGDSMALKRACHDFRLRQARAGRAAGARHL